MMILNRSVLAGIGVAAVLSVAPMTSGTAGATTRPTAPKALLAASLKAAGKQSSVHSVATSTVGTQSIKITADAATKAGTQVIILREGKKTGHLTGRYVNNTVYFRGDTIGLEDYLGMPATLAPKYSGKWISFASTTQGYSSVANSMTVSAAVSQISVKAPITSSGQTTVNGQAAVGVRGTTTTLSSKGKKGTATLYVSAKGSPLPIRYLGTGIQKKQKETGQVTFSKWGETVSPTAPTGAVPASSITTSTSSSSSSSTTG
jgi:hypothetical protein